MERRALRRGGRILRLAGARPSIHQAWHYVDFDRLLLPQFCCMKTGLHTFAAQMLAAKSSIYAAHIWFLETGGTKNHGRTPSGICNWTLENWFGVTNRRQPGELMGFMTDKTVIRNSRIGIAGM
jgi:hypothetical protein